MELILSILSDNALYLYQVLSKYLIGFQSYARVVTNVDGRAYGRTDGWTDGRTDGKSDPCIAPCLRQAQQKGVFKSKQFFYLSLRKI